MIWHRANHLEIPPASGCPFFFLKTTLNLYRAWQILSAIYPTAPA